MAHPTAHAPTPNEGTGQDEPELTKTGGILGVSRQSLSQWFAAGALAQ
jgi:hypothetical protein